MVDALVRGTEICLQLHATDMGNVAMMQVVIDLPSIYCSIYTYSTSIWYREPVADS